ncbi:MAG: hypothetical protein ABFE08_13020, partial [Armatimonadia bacterium]
RLPEVKEGENAWGDYVQLFHLREDGSGPRLRRVGELSERQLKTLDSFGPTDDEQRKLRHAPAVRRTIAALEAASRKPRMAAPITFEDGWVDDRDVSKLCVCGRICQNQARAAALEGDVAQAGELLLVALRIAGQLAQRPTVMAQAMARNVYRAIVDSGEQILASGTIPALQSKQLRRELDLQRSHLTMGWQRALPTERAEKMSLYRSFEWQREEAVRYPCWELVFPCYGPADNVAGTIAYSLANIAPYWRRQQMITLDTLQRLTPLAQAPAEHLTELVALRNSLDKDSIDIATVMGFALAATIIHSQVAQLRMNQFSVALALNDYYRERGRYPERLGELPQPLPGDVLSGEAFRYRRVGAKYLLYAIGADRRDDGGKGPKPRQADEAGDWVWETERRR